MRQSPYRVKNAIHFLRFTCLTSLCTIQIETNDAIHSLAGAVTIPGRTDLYVANRRFDLFVALAILTIRFFLGLNADSPAYERLMLDEI